MKLTQPLADREVVDSLSTYLCWPVHRLTARHERSLLLVSGARSGSELLCRTLDGHPGVRLESELLAHARWAPRAFLAGRSVRNGVLRGRAWGCKIIDSHLLVGPNADGDLLRHASDAGFQLVHLRRRNRLLQALSVSHASRTEYHFDRADRSVFAMFEPDPRELLHLMRHLDICDQRMASLMAELPHIALTYEDDLAAPESLQQTYNVLCDRIGVQRRSVGPPPLRRITPAAAAERVTNREAIITALESTRFAPHLDALGIGGDGP